MVVGLTLLNVISLHYWLQFYGVLGGEGRVLGHLRAAETKGWQSKYFKLKKSALSIFQVFFFLPWYTTHSGCVFYSPLSGFSLLVYEVT